MRRVNLRPLSSTLTRHAPPPSLPRLLKRFLLIHAHTVQILDACRDVYAERESSGSEAQAGGLGAGASPAGGSSAAAAAAARGVRGLAPYRAAINAARKRPAGDGDLFY